MISAACQTEVKLGGKAAARRNEVYRIPDLSRRKADAVNGVEFDQMF
jgi:hypothetical protein